MSMRRSALLVVLLFSVLFVPTLSSADELAGKGREIVKNYKDAILIVRMVIKGGMSFRGSSHQEESKAEATGVVIDPNGLMVVPLSETDPYGEIGSLLSSMGSSRGVDINIKSELTDVKIVLGDGSEIAGKVVLRDRDLDLAFVRPLEKPAQPMTSIDLTKDVQLDLLDVTICLDRMTSAYDRVPHIAVGRVKSIVEKPRKYYLVEGTTTGAPVFDVEGRILGINLSTPNSSSDDSDSVMEYLRTAAGEMVLPAADIHEAALQAPEVDQVKDEVAEPVGSATGEVEAATGEESK
jgi:hypothetical protein